MRFPLKNIPKSVQIQIQKVAHLRIIRQTHHTVILRKPSIPCDPDLPAVQVPQRKFHRLFSVTYGVPELMQIVCFRPQQRTRCDKNSHGRIYRRYQRLRERFMKSCSQMLFIDQRCIYR